MESCRRTTNIRSPFGTAKPSFSRGGTRCSPARSGGAGRADLWLYLLARCPDIGAPRPFSSSQELLRHESPRLGKEDVRQLQDHPPPRQGPSHLFEESPPQAKAGKLDGSY